MNVTAYRTHLDRLYAGEKSSEEAIAEVRDEIALSTNEELRPFREMIALQGIIGEQLPFKLLVEADEELLEKFVQKLYDHQVPICILHRALKAVVEYAKRPYDLPVLESLLQDIWEKRDEDSFWELFETADPETLAENQKLKASMPVSGYVLDEEIGRAQTNTRCFKIKNSDLVICFPKNPAIPGLMKYHALQQRMETRSHCLPLNEPVLTDPNGRFYTVKRLRAMLGGPSWKNPVMEWLSWLRENQITPTHFKAEYIHFDSEGVLTTVKEMRPLRYNVRAMHAFAKRIAGGDANLYQQIVGAVGLDAALF